MVDEALLEGANDELREAVQALIAERTELASWKQTQEVNEQLKAKGLPEKAGALYLKSGLESIDEFVTEYGELFGINNNDGVNNHVKEGFKKLEATGNGASPNTRTAFTSLEEAATKGPQAIVDYMRTLRR